MTPLLQFLDRLDSHHLPHTLTSVRPWAIMVQFAVPGERSEVELMTDGAVAVERFRSDGTIGDEAMLRDFWTILAIDAGS